MTTPTTAENERLASEHFDRVWNRGEVDTDALADDYRVHTHLGVHEAHTLEEFRAFVAGAREGLPDLRKEPDDVFGTDERVTIRYTMTATHRGEMLGIPPTGESVEITGVAIYHIEDGALAEAWYVSDFLRMLRQVGAVD
jgi:steroid delta-isomerase-like uncharacterized protein